MKANPHRISIIAMHARGESVSDIARALGVHRSTVFRTIERQKKTGGLWDRPGRGRKPTVVTPEVVHAVRNRIARSPHRSIRKLADDFNMAPDSMRRIVKGKLHLTPYDVREAAILSMPKVMPRIAKKKTVNFEVPEAEEVEEKRTKKGTKKEVKNEEPEGKVQKRSISRKVKEIEQEVEDDSDNDANQEEDSDDDFVPAKKVLKRTQKKKTVVKKEETEETEQKRAAKKRETKTVKQETKTVTVRKPKSVPEGFTEEQDTILATKGAAVTRAVGKSRKLLGYHATAAGALDRSIYDALSMGCRSFALFLRNQRQWNAKPLEPEIVGRWQRAVKATGVSLSLVLPHGSYLMNPGSPKADVLEKTREAMLDECRRAQTLGIQMYNFHPGSTIGLCTREECIATIAETMNYVLENTKGVTLVVETMAGQGNTVGGTFEELAEIIASVHDKSRVGICIDTCHIFAAGYDIRSPKAYEATMSQFEKVVGFQYLRALHVNDSKGDLGCHLDRHEHIGKGKIGFDGFRNFMRDPRMNDIPMILETPAGEEDREMVALYGLE